MVVGIKKNPSVLIHESRMLSNIFRFISFNTLAVFIFSGVIISPFEENVRAVLAFRPPCLMRLEKRCFPVRKPVHRIRETISIVRVLCLRPCDQRFPHIMMGDRRFYLLLD